MAGQSSKVAVHLGASFLGSLAIYAAAYYFVLVAPAPERAKAALSADPGQILFYAVVGYGLYGLPLAAGCFLGLMFLAPSRAAKVEAKTAPVPSFFDGKAYFTPEPSEGDELARKPSPRPESPEAGLGPGRSRNPWVVLGYSAALALLGFLVTPVAVYVLGLLMLSGLPGYSAQGQGFTLFLASLFSALPGAVYGASVGAILAGRGPRPGGWMRWSLALSIYSVAVLALILIVWVKY